jgi:hypothetical protein
VRITPPVPAVTRKIIANSLKAISPRSRAACRADACAGPTFQPQQDRAHCQRGKGDICWRASRILFRGGATNHEARDATRQIATLVQCLGLDRRVKLSGSARTVVVSKHGETTARHARAGRGIHAAKPAQATSSSRDPRLTGQPRDEPSHGARRRGPIIPSRIRRRSLILDILVRKPTR